jgi:hypothetical protein
MNAPIGSSRGPRWSRDRVYNALLEAGLQPTRDTDDFMAQCPVHADRTPSLHVTWANRPSGGGLTKLWCLGCNASRQEIAEAVGLTDDDLFDEPLPPRPAWPAERVGRSPRQRQQGPTRGKTGRLPKRIVQRAPAPPEPRHRWVTVDTYVYVDTNAEVVEEVIRRQCSSCPLPHKSFSQRFAAGAAHMVTKKPAGFTPVLYRLPEVRAAVADGTPVWLMEGEKDVHSAEQLGLVATTNAGGGAVFPESLAEELLGANVQVVLDRDDTGWARGVALYKALVPRGAQVRLLLPATTEAKSDFSDHVEAGYQLDDLVEVRVEELRVWAALRPLVAKLERTVRGDYEEEAHARLALAVAADAAGDATGAHTERRYAQRWAQAALTVWEGLRDDVERIREQASAIGTRWAQQAAGRAASIQVQAREVARDLHEHTGLPIPGETRQEQEPARGRGHGHDLAQPATGDGKNAGGEGGGGGGSADAGSAGAGGEGRRKRRRLAGMPSYEVRQGCLVEIKFEKKEVIDPETQTVAEEWVEKPKILLDLDVQIVAYEYPDRTEPGEELDAARLRGRESRQERVEVREEQRPSHVVFSYTHPVTQAPERIRVEMDRATDSSWLSALGFPLAYDSKTAGRAKVWDAIRSSSWDAEQQKLFLGTGWRLLPEHGWGWVHNGGAITAKGNVAVPVHLTGPLRRFDLPDPVDDPEALQAAWRDHVLPLFEELPARLGVPLVGHAFRAVLGVNPWLGLLLGSPGSGKTSLASLLMHFYGEAWDRRRPAVSMSGNGATDNAARLIAHHARDALMFLDDVAPGKDTVEAQVRLGRIARMLTNGEARTRLDRNMQMQDGQAPATTGLMTSELPPRPGSEAERTFQLPIQADDLDLDVLIRLDKSESRYGRALLGSAFRQWAAADLLQLQDRAGRVAAEFAKTLRDDGRPTREADAYGNLYAGWAVLLDFLVEVGALTEAERQELDGRVTDALWSAMAAAENPDMPIQRGNRIREMIAHAFTTGICHVVDIRTGDMPEWPLASRLGWRRSPAPGGPSAGSSSYPGADGAFRYDPRGTVAGWVNLSPRTQDGPAQVVMSRLQLDQVITAAAKTLTDAPVVDAMTALRDLADPAVNVLISQRRGADGSVAGYTASRTIAATGGRQRMVVLDLAKLLGDEPLDGQRGGGGDGPEGSGGRPDHDESPQDGPGGSLHALPSSAGEADDPALFPAAIQPDPQPAEQPAAAAVGTSAAAVVGPGREPGAHDDAVVARGGAHLAGVAERPVEDEDDDQAVMDEDDDPHEDVVIEMPAIQPPLVTQHTDRDGVVGNFQVLISHRATCLMCPLPCVMCTDGLPFPIHPRCWNASTAGERAEAIAARQTPAQTGRAEPQAQDRARDQERPAAPAAAAPAARSGARAGGGGAAARPGARSAAGSASAGASAAGLRFTWDGRAAGSAPVVAVCHTDRIVLGTGEVQPLPELAHLGDLAGLAERFDLSCPATRGHVEPGTVVITTQLAAQLGLPTRDLGVEPEKAFREATVGHPFVLGAIEAGWHLGGGDRGEQGGPGLRGWNRLTHSERRTVRVAVQHVMVGAVVEDDPGPEQLAARLQRFAELMGYPWRLSGGPTGIDLMLGLRWADREELFPAKYQKIEPAQEYIEAEWDWSRTPLEHERRMQFMHLYDRGGSYAAAIAGLELPIGAAEHHPNGAGFDPRLPGLHRVVMTDAANRMVPHPLGVRAHARFDDGTACVMTPALQLAHDLEHPVQIVESWVWPRHARVLESWYQRIRDARSAVPDLDPADPVVREVFAVRGLPLPAALDPVDAVVRAMIKEVYTQGIGNIASVEKWVGKPGYFPERRLLIVSKARSNTLRRVHQIGKATGRWPLAMNKDSVAYASDDPNPVTAWPGEAKLLGWEFGQFKPERSGPLEPQLAHLRGYDWRGKPQLVKAREWMSALGAVEGVA